MTSFAAQIKERALEAGITSIGIVPAEPLVGEGNRLSEWLRRGYNGEMAWLAREPEKRADPRMIFARAKSVIVTTHNYFTPHQHKDAPGKISRYAWGDDYHDVVREKLSSLLDWIKSQRAEVNG